MRYQVEAQWMMTEVVVAIFEFYDDANDFAVKIFESDKRFVDANIYVVDVLNDYVYVKWERSH
jgi:hypothetical protein